MSADEDLRRAAKLARQLADHTIADALDLAVRDHERGSCAAVEQGEECYREKQAREYLAEHRDVPLLPSERDAELQDLREALALSRALVKRRNREYGRASATIGELRGALARKTADYREAAEDAACMQIRLDDAKRERDELRAHGVARDIGQANDELRAELKALKAKRVWRTAPISGVMHLVPHGRRESVCGLLASTTWRDAVDGNAGCLECMRWQPDTEATEQDGSELQCDALGEGACRYLEGHDGGCKPKFGGGEQPCEHGILRGMMACPVCDPEKQAEAEESARAHAARSQVGWTDPAPATPTEQAAPRYDVEIDIRDHVLTGSAIAENPEHQNTAFVMAHDVRAIVREWCKANGIPVDTEATTESAERAAVSRRVAFVDDAGRVQAFTVDQIVDAVEHGDKGPATPTEPRVWRDIHEQEWTERPDGLILTYQGFAFSRSQLEELVGPLTEVVEDGAT